MAIRIKYTYAVYEDFQEATAISESRARNAQFIITYCGIGTIASLICLFVDFSKTWPLVFLLLGCVLGLISLFSGHYDAVTEKKVNKAIAKYISGNRKFIESNKKVDALDVSAKVNTKQCVGCGNIRRTRHCVVRKSGHALGLPLCEDCISKLKAKVKEF